MSKSSLTKTVRKEYKSYHEFEKKTKTNSLTKNLDLAIFQARSKQLELSELNKTHSFIRKSQQ